MTDNCQLVFVRQREDGKYVHRCLLCRTEQVSKYADPSMRKVQCRVKMRQKAIEESKQPEYGPGTELTKLISELGLAQFGCGACKELAGKMDRWGPQECRVRREEIILDIRQRAAKVGWWEKSKAALAAVKTGWWHPLDNIGSMVDEAIRRAETLAISDQNKVE